MKYEILKDFPGSQDGRTTEQFSAGTEVELSDYLANIVVREGWARPVSVDEDGAVDVENKAIVTDGRRRKVKS